MKNCNCLHSHICPHTLAAMGLYLHIVPGRLRCDVPGMRDDARAAVAVQSSLANLNGVRKVRCSSETGRVLIEYDVRTVQVESILDRVFQVPEAARADSTGFGLKSWVANSVLGQAAGFVLENVFKLALG